MTTEESKNMYDVTNAPMPSNHNNSFHVLNAAYFRGTQTLMLLHLRLMCVSDAKKRRNILFPGLRQWLRG